VSASAEGATGRSKGVSQFGRALAALNIDIIHLREFAPGEGPRGAHEQGEIHSKGGTGWNSIPTR
jgi:hypothetical protein